mmetsp:Transcript_108997/g.303111  ORF Transcript_108997/g.303111 Transcript_108997/m.303111 type:complete len:201 (-) Transcript_108997:149-751(-)
MRKRPMAPLGPTASSSPRPRRPKERRPPLGGYPASEGRSELRPRFAEPPRLRGPPGPRGRPRGDSPSEEQPPQESALTERALPRPFGATQQRPSLETKAPAPGCRRCPALAGEDQSKSKQRTRYAMSRRMRVLGAATQNGVGKEGKASSEEHLSTVNNKARSLHTSSGGGFWFHTTSSTQPGNKSGDSAAQKMPEYKRPL